MGGAFQRRWSPARSTKAAGRSTLSDSPTSPEFPLVPPFGQLLFNANHMHVMSPLLPPARTVTTAAALPSGDPWRKRTGPRPGGSGYGVAEKSRLARVLE